MRRLNLFGLALMSAFAVGGVVAGAACAESTPLPDIHTALPGEVYPIDLGGSLEGVSELVNESGGFLKGDEFSILLTAKELTSLGEAIIEFLGVKNGEGRKCNSQGDAEANGAVLIPNAEYHLVYSGLSPANTLELVALVLFTKFTIFCGAGTFEVTLTGPATSRISVPSTAGNPEGDSTDIETATHCGNRTTAIQEIPYYFNDALAEVPTTLLGNPSGTGNKKACEEIEGTVLLDPETGSAATMFSILY